MKNLKLLSFLMVFASSLMFIQCTTDTLVGPAGANGVDGADGISGIDGVDGLDGIDGLDGESIAECVACHSNSHRDAIYDAYARSKHATETTMYNGQKLSQYGNRENCASCHTNQGFIDRFTIGDIDATGPYSSNSDQAISCTACHNLHRSFDFANDGNDMALRTLAPVELYVDASYTIDSKNESDMLGASNTCVQCHQPRTETPVADADGYFKITSSHYGPHHGPQSTLLEGIQGYEFSSTGISAPNTAAHKTKTSCVACHMPTVEEGHDWEPADYASTTCTTCHGAKAEVEGYEAGMATLGTLLDAVVGWEYFYIIDRDGDGVTGDPILADGKIVFLDAVGGNVVSSSNAVIMTDVDGVKLKQDFIGYPGTGFYGKGAFYSINDAGAGWNYLFLNEDKSNGVHNPSYAQALIAQSILALQ